MYVYKCIHVYLLICSVCVSYEAQMLPHVDIQMYTYVCIQMAWRTYTLFFFCVYVAPASTRCVCIQMKYECIQMYAFEYIFTGSVCVSFETQTLPHVCIYMYTYKRIHVYVFIGCGCASFETLPHVCIQMQTLPHVCIQMHTYVCIQMYTSLFIYR